MRIREAKTEAFTVKDHRGELYKRHYPPAMNDEVWRLEKIGKDGSFHRRLNNDGIFTVEDFLQLVVRDSQKLRNILGSGMSNKMWDCLIEHAKTCVLSGKLHIYYPDETRTVYVDTWVKKAYDNWSLVVEYDGKSLMNFKQMKKSSTLKSDLPLGPVDYPNAIDNQLPHQRMPVSIPFEPSVDQGSLTGVPGYIDDMATRYGTPTQLMDPSSNSPFGGEPFPQNNHQLNQFQSNAYSNRVGLALGLPQSSPSVQDSSSCHPPAALNPFEEWPSTREKNDFLSEEAFVYKVMKCSRVKICRICFGFSARVGMPLLVVPLMMDLASLPTCRRLHLASVIVRIGPVPVRLLWGGSRLKLQ